MSRIRGANTRPEKLVRSMLHRMGLRFTVNGPGNKGLPGRPDIVLPRWKTAVFVHGCFWHGHEHCRLFKWPTARRDWWEAKILGNRKRDEERHEAVKLAGWKVITVWECELENVSSREALLLKLARNFPM
jgi:DNA mismatch endonuclease, patch repair protein